MGEPAVAPMRHLSDSANIARYREHTASATSSGYVWCEVLRELPIAPKLPDGSRDWEAVRDQLPTFRFTIVRQGVGEIARLTYRPRRRPRPGALPARTVTRLVRQALAEAEQADPNHDAGRRPGA